MTTDQPSFDDVQLSAALDGHVEPEVAARLDQDPAARIRLDQLRTARDLVATAAVPPLADAEIDRLLATALEAADPAAGDGRNAAPGSAPPAAMVAPSRGRRPDPVPPWLVAAVVVVLVGIGLALVYTGRDDGADVAFETVGQSISGAADDRAGGDDGSAALEAPDAAASGAAESDPAEDTPSTTLSGGEASTATAPELVPLGSFADADALREHLRDGFPAADAGSAPATETDVDAAFRCLGKIDGMFGTASEPVHVGLATVAGEATVVYELPYRTDEGRDTTLVVAVGELTCIPSLSFQR